MSGFRAIVSLRVTDFKVEGFEVEGAATSALLKDPLLRARYPLFRTVGLD